MNMYEKVEPGRIRCVVCGVVIVDKAVTRAAHEKGTRHMNRMMKRALGQRGIGTVPWSDLFFSKRKRRS